MNSHKCPLCHLPLLIEVDDENFECMNCGYHEHEGMKQYTQMPNDVTESNPWNLFDD